MRSVLHCDTLTALVQIAFKKIDMHIAYSMIFTNQSYAVFRYVQIYSQQIFLLHVTLDIVKYLYK